MPITLVYVEVKPEYIEAFKKVSMYNCENSRKEEGNISFDLFQETENPAKFVLCEHFRDREAIDYHKTTEHYKKWAEEASEYMASPRTRTVYNFIE